MVVSQQTRLANNIDATSQNAKYDHSVKVVLANKAILSWILKCCVAEFADCDVADISQYIEGKPDVSTKAVHRDEPDLDSNAAISGANSEDNSSKEQTVYFDIRFKVLLPHAAESMEMWINVESQMNATTYPIEKRAIYYLSRLLCSQYGTVFTKSHYEKLEKVYSIWICSNPPKEKQNTIHRFYLQDEVVYGKIDVDCANIDLMQGIIINIGQAEDKLTNPILHLLNTLLSSSMKAEAKKDILNTDFHIKMTETLDSEVTEMCNLSIGVYNEGIAEGGAEKAKKAAINMHKKGESDTYIAEILEESLETVRQWIKDKAI